MRCHPFIIALQFSSMGLVAQPVIRDNSFLMEEAFNQEAGVIQHINAVIYNRPLRLLAGNFTEEWPLGSEAHQLSLTVPYFNEEANCYKINDVMINYRYQLVARQNLFIAPRFTMILPTGNPNTEFAAGMTGFQFNVPLSYEINNKFTIHANVGNSYSVATATRKETNVENSESLAYGISGIYNLSGVVNFMVEAIHTAYINEYYSGKKISPSTTIINPGLRFGINLPSGMQIVPGIALPYDVESETASCFFYLSVEHSILRKKQ